MADDARPTADLIERDEVPVLFLRVRDDVDEMSRAWERLEAVVGLRGRKLYRAFDARTLEYRVCVLAKERDDPTVFGLESGTLPGGRYLRARLRGEPPEVYERIGPTFEALERAARPGSDATRPNIEHYRRRGEIDLLLPVAE
ncbi:MAG: AraC family transcriptional regulator [Actinobacteria bacterium]|nr:AraC family transcriptional regulator [Actinomycetota bacterium]